MFKLLDAYPIPYMAPTLKTVITVIWPACHLAYLTAMLDAFQVLKVK